MARTARWACAVLSSFALVAVLTTPATATGQPSGQRVWGQSSIEPAINDADGSLVYINTPFGAPFPSKSAEASSAPLWLPVYPPGSGVETGDVVLNCHPSNCDHANILPGAAITGTPLASVYPVQPGTNPSCAHFDASNGNVDGSGTPLPCAPLLGHDHLIGIPPTGDWKIAWDVHLVLFTSVPTHVVRTLSELQGLLTSGGAIDAGEIVTFNCSRVSSVVYDKATPLSF